MAQRAKQGPYRGRIVIGRDDNGKEISRYVTAATRKELEQKKLSSVSITLMEFRSNLICPSISTLRNGIG